MHKFGKLLEAQRTCHELGPIGPTPASRAARTGTRSESTALSLDLETPRMDARPSFPLSRLDTRLRCPTCGSQELQQVPLALNRRVGKGAGACAGDVPTRGHG